MTEASVEDLFNDYPSLDPTVILALAQDVPQWNDSPEAESTLREMLNGLNTSAETEAAVAALEIGSSQQNNSDHARTNGSPGDVGDGTASDAFEEEAVAAFDWPEELQFLSQVCPGKSQTLLMRALRQNTGDIEVRSKCLPWRIMPFDRTDTLLKLSGCVESNICGRIDCVRGIIQPI